MRTELDAARGSPSAQRAPLARDAALADRRQGTGKTGAHPRPAGGFDLRMRKAGLRCQRGPKRPRAEPEGSARVGWNTLGLRARLAMG